MAEKRFKRMYYKVHGNPSNGVKCPLIVLHGGPGLVHDYLVCHSDLSIKYGIPIILYDQLGNGKSTHLREKAPEFCTMELFVAELENLIHHLGIQDDFDILGHSWGGVLGSEFAVRKQPHGLKHLVVANSLAAYSLWTQSTLQLLWEFPEDIKQGVIGGMEDPQKFLAAVKKFHAVHGCTVKPVPEEYLYMMDQVFGPDGDRTVTNAGILKNWTIVERLHLISVPTFVINGRKDIAQDFVVRPFFDIIPKVRWVTLENSSHMPFLEERERYMEIVGRFLVV